MAGNRRSIRLKGFDYATEGAYFVTMVCYDRIHWFGKVIDGTLVLSDAGKIAEEEWLKSAELRQEITLDAFVLMPNHVHGIVIIGNPDLKGDGGKGGWPSAQTPSAQTPSDLASHSITPYSRTPEPAEWRSPTKNLGSMVRGFKIGCTTRIRKEISPNFGWIRNYYERIVRDRKALEAIRRYIKNNPSKWNE